MLTGLDGDPIYRSLFSAYPDALLLVDTQGRIVLANPAASELLGYGSDELTGLTVDALVPDAVRARHSQYRADYGKNPRPRPMGTQMDLVARRRDGSEVMVEIALSPLQHSQPPLVVAAIRGIGTYPRVKQAIQRARYSECVAEVGRLAVDSRDPQALLSQVPGVAARALGVDSAVLLRLQPNGLELSVAASAGLGDVEGDALLPNRRDTLHGFALAHERPTVVEDWAHEARFAMPEGYRRHGIASSIVVPLSDRGRAIGLLALHARRPQASGDDEIHFLQSLCNLLSSSLQRAESEEALAHSQRMESVGQLTGGIAHDFNNLLTVVQGNLQVLQELPVLQTADARDLVLSASRAAKRAGELTSKLLAFSRRQVLQPARIDVHTMLQSLADMLKRTLDQHVRIKLDIEADCPPVHADPGQLESALLNIAINARDAMPNGGLLSFSARAVSDHVAISVADTGCGMSDDVRERAFEPFFTTKAKGRGTGLGLSTVYGFVKQSKGSVEIDTAPGRGTAVILHLPRWRGAEADADTADPGARAALPRHLKVLLVEDEPEVRKVIGTFLEALGVKFTVAPDGERALAWLKADGDVDLLLTDVALGPGLRGTDLARLAKEHDPDLAVLLMSGFAAELLEAEGEQALPWEFLRKPCSRDELAAALARALAASRE
jgi:PAS domain S-box-containing protein